MVSCTLGIVRISAKRNDEFLMTNDERPNSQCATGKRSLPVLRARLLETKRAALEVSGHDDPWRDLHWQTALASGTRPVAHDQWHTTSGTRPVAHDQWHTTSGTQSIECAGH